MSRRSFDCSQAGASLAQPHPAMRWLRGALWLLVAWLCFAQGAHAQFATGGSGLHRERIFWVSFGNAGDNVYAGRTITRSFNVGSPASAANLMEITCTLSNAATTAGTAGLTVYTPGSWRGDGLDDLYNIGGAQTGSTGANPNTLAIGLRTNGVSTVEFDFSCSATLGGAPFVLNGLVFADAEASGNTEYVAARLTSGGTLRIIDSISNCGNPGTVAVTAGPPQEVQLVPGGLGSCEANVTPALRAGPALVGFIDGATSARVIARGGGISAVAVGAVLDIEYSEALPASYGVATHVLQSSWTGGLAVSGVDYTQQTNLATFSTAPPRLGTLNLPDTNADGAIGGPDVDALAKTTGPLGNGYANVAPPTARGATYTVSNVACFGPGSVAGWIDFDGNGVFDASERSSVAGCGAGANTVALSWTVPAGYVAQPTSYMRLRVGPNAADVALPTGIVDRGETEDYRIVLPSLSADMAVSITGFPADPNPGSAVSGTVSCTNNGPDPAFAATCSVPTAGLPVGATVVCTPAPAPNPLAVGAALSCAVNFTAPPSGTVTVTGTAATSSTDPVAPNNVASTVISVSPGADMSATTSVPTAVTPGQSVTATGVCINNGPGSAAAPTCALSGLPPGASQVCLPSPAANPLPVGSAITCTSTFTVPPSGTLSITTAAGASTLDPNSTNNTATAATGPIDAVNDTAAAPVEGGSGGTAIANVLANDTLGGATATLAGVTLRQTATTNAGVTLDAASGAVSVAPGTPAGSHTVTYEICTSGSPAVCDTATASVTVSAAPIDAVDDATITVGTLGGTAVGSASLLANDTLNGAPVVPSQVTLTLTGTGGLSGLTVDADGHLVVPTGAAPGSYVVSYQICDRLNPTRCDTATVPVVVQGAISGSVWLDSGAGGSGTPNRQRDGGESGMSGWVVEALFAPGHPQAGQLATNVAGQPATATSDANGNYEMPGLAAGNYQLRFRAPAANGQPGPIYGTPVNGEQGTPQAGSTVNRASRLLDITVPVGGGLSQQSLPVDPSGVVYDAVSRRPVTGATVTLIGPDAQPVPATQLLPGQQGQTVVASGAAAGSYRFDLLGTAPAGVYTLEVAAPAGYASPSASLPPAAALPYQAGPAAYLVVPSALAPQSGEPTTYHLQFTLNPAAGGADILHNHIPLDPATQALLAIDKRASVTTAELGDLVRYTIRVRNLSATSAAPSVRVIDQLPLGFRYVAGTARVQAVPVTLLANPAGAPGPQLTFALGDLAPSQTFEFSYHLKLGVASADGDGINRAFAESGAQRSLTAQAAVKVGGGVFRSQACFAGKIFSDCGNRVGQGNGNGIQDPGEPGIPGVRLYLEDGTHVVSDSEGKYSVCGLSARTHVLKVDPLTLPPGSRLGVTANRNAGDPGSLFLDLKKGELAQADFRDMSCKQPVADDIERRRSALRKRMRGGDVTAPNVMGDGRTGPGLGLDGREGAAR